MLLFFLIVFALSGITCKKLLCYYDKATEERPSAYRLLPRNIDPDLCTHIVYIMSISEFDAGPFLPLMMGQGITPQLTERTEEMLELRRRNVGTTLMLSLGGWKEGSAKFSMIVSEPQMRYGFIQVICNYVRKIEFHGVEINWQWPVLRERSKPQDKINYALFIQELKSFIEKETKDSNITALLLSVTLPPFSYVVSCGYDMATISKEADILPLMTMDYHLSTDPQVNHHAPLYTSPGYSWEPYTVASTVKFYLEMGVDPEKMILGIPLYGRSYILESVYQTRPGASSDDEGREGFATRNPGTLAYFEICAYISQPGWRVEHPDPAAMGPYAYNDLNWVAYDDSQIIQKKVDLVHSEGLGGVFVWTIDMDDFSGKCLGRFPLVKAAKESLLNFTAQPTTAQRPKTKEWENNVTGKGWIIYEEPYSDNDVPMRPHYCYPSKTTHSTTTTTTPTTTSTTTTTIKPRVTISTSNNIPDACNTSFDAVSLIGGNTFMFKNKYMWQVGENGPNPGYPELIRRQWRDLPKNFTKVDAVYERLDRKIVFFIGNQHWVFDGNRLESRYPLPLTDFGLPETLEKIDAAMVWGHNSKAYLYSGTKYWRMDDVNVNLDYPRDISGIWSGIPYHIDAVMQWKDGATYFFKGKDYWKFDDLRMRAVEKKGQPISVFWMGCEH